MPVSPRRAVRSARSGITLVELLVVMAIVALMMGLAYPNVTSGLDGIRLKMTADRVGSFWAAARQRADRYQEVVQVTVDPKAGELRAVGAESDWRDSLALEPSLRIVSSEERVSYLIYPGMPSPKFAVMMASETGGRAGVEVNVLTGVPEHRSGDEGR